MRPVNLIPPEERRGDRAPLRKGALSYAIVGGLAAILVGTVMVVMTNNTIGERKAEIVTLEASEAAARAEAESLSSFAEFSSISGARVSTVSSLAQSRFDWDRILRELSLVIPEDVALTELDGSVAGGSSGGSRLSAGVTGPSLSMAGCAADHQAVARFLQDLRDIDGVTRVGISGSRVIEDGEGGESGSETACPPEARLAEFEITAAFDEVTVPLADPAPTAEATATPASADNGIADAQAEEQAVRDSIDEQSEKARKATNLIPGVER